MAFKRYLTKGGKQAGPYYYENVRTPEGKVKSIYLGSAQPTSPSRRLFSLFIIIMFLAALLGVSLFLSKQDLTPPGFEAKAFETDQQMIKVLLKEGESITKPIRVMNTGQKEIPFKIQTLGLGDLVQVSNPEFSLKPGQTQIVDLNFVSSFPERKILYNPDVYVGQITVEANNERSEVPTVIEIESKKVLFDMNLNIAADRREVPQGQTTTAEVTLFNLQLVTPANVRMEYAVKDLQGNTILTETETVVIETRASFYKTFKIPANMAAGTYIFLAKAQYGSSTGTSTYTFDVVSPKKEKEAGITGICSPEQPVCKVSLIVLILLVFFIGAYAYFFVGSYVFQRINRPLPAKGPEKPMRWPYYLALALAGIILLAILYKKGILAIGKNKLAEIWGVLPPLPSYILLALLAVVALSLIAHEFVKHVVGMSDWLARIQSKIREARKKKESEQQKKTLERKLWKEKEKRAKQRMGRALKTIFSTVNPVLAIRRSLKNMAEKLKLPSLKLPKFKLPSFRLPKFRKREEARQVYRVPVKELPKLPVVKVKRPWFKLPRIRLPKFKLPKFHLPKFRLPKIKLPSIHLPKFRLPKFRLPEFKKKEEARQVYRVPVKELPKLPVVKVKRPWFKLPKIRLPRFKLPKVRLPKFSLPKFRLPKVHLPKFRLPSLKLPKLRLPKFKLPSFRLPKFKKREEARQVYRVPVKELPKLPVVKVRKPWFKLPRIRLPKIKLPKVRLPRFKLPKVRLPKFRLPKFRLPKVRLPRFKLPSLKLPKFRLPKFKLPSFRLPKFKKKEQVHATPPKPVPKLPVIMIKEKKPSKIADSIRNILSKLKPKKQYKHVPKEVKEELAKQIKEKQKGITPAKPMHAPKLASQIKKSFSNIGKAFKDSGNEFKQKIVITFKKMPEPRIQETKKPIRPEAKPSKKLLEKTKTMLSAAADRFKMLGRAIEKVRERRKEEKIRPIEPKPARVTKPTPAPLPAQHPQQPKGLFSILHNMGLVKTPEERERIREMKAKIKVDKERNKQVEALIKQLLNRVKQQVKQRQFTQAELTYKEVVRDFKTLSLERQMKLKQKILKEYSKITKIRDKIMKGVSPP